MCKSKPYFYLWSNWNLELLNGMLWMYLSTNFTRTVCSSLLLVSMSIRSHMYVAAIYYLSSTHGFYLWCPLLFSYHHHHYYYHRAFSKLGLFFWNELFRRYFQNVLCLKVLYIGACAITSFNSSIFKISVGKLCNIFNHTIVASLNWCTVFNKTVF